MNLKTLSAHLRTPLYRNSYALVANTIVTSGLGVLYWLVAARLFAMMQARDAEMERNPRGWRE